ncbi:MAG: hypothetical protein M5U09_26755 [Gammaproteobacteria bacterium]|nr:hypothetical protein [Gammaproteobacteria bacterium]
MTHQSTRDGIELFLQGEGIADITLVLVPATAPLRTSLRPPRLTG